MKNEIFIFLGISSEKQCRKNWNLRQEIKRNGWLNQNTTIFGHFLTKMLYFCILSTRKQLLASMHLKIAIFPFLGKENFANFRQKKKTFFFFCRNPSWSVGAVRKFRSVSVYFFEFSFRFRRKKSRKYGNFKTKSLFQKFRSLTHKFQQLVRI